MEDDKLQLVHAQELLKIVVEIEETKVVSPDVQGKRSEEYERAVESYPLDEVARVNEFKRILLNSAVDILRRLKLPASHPEVALALNHRAKEVSSLAIKENEETRRLIRMVAGTKRILGSELYRSETHFVQELIQNADDSKYPTPNSGEIVFTIHDDRIEVETNESGFTWQDVQAISDIGNEFKEPGQIGEKGVGFKSVFSVCDVATIQSNGYCFMFDAGDNSRTSISFTVPTPCPPLTAAQPLKAGTILSLKLKPSTVVREYEAEFDIHSLLFLRNLRKVSFRYVNNRQETITYESHVIGTGKYSTTMQLTKTSSLESDPKKSEFILVKLLIDKMDNVERLSRKSSKEVEMVLAFPVCNGTCIPQNLSDNQPSLFAFLPIKNGKGFSFLINSDFVLETNREDIREGTWNKRLMKMMAKGFVDHAFKRVFRKVPELRDTYFTFLQTIKEDDSTCLKVKERIVKQLKTKKCIRVIRNDDKKKGKPKWAKPSGCVIDFSSGGVRASHIFEGFVESAIHLRFIHASPYHDFSATFRALGARDFNTQDLIACLKSQGLTSLLKRDSAISMDLWKFLAHHPDQQTILQNLPSCKVFKVMLEGRQDMVSLTAPAKTVFLPAGVSLKDYSFANSMYRVVEDSVDMNSRAVRQLLISVQGVKESSPSNVVKSFILPFLKKDTRHFRDCAAFILRNIADLRQMEEIQKEGWLQDRNHRFRPLSSLYLSSHYVLGDTQVKLENLIPGAAFVREDYPAEGAIQSWGRALCSLDIAYLPRQSDWDSLLKDTSKRVLLFKFVDERWNFYKTQNDKIKQLSELQIKCLDGIERKAKDTYSVSLKRKYGDELPYFPIPIGDAFRLALGLRSMDNKETILSHLEWMKRIGIPQSKPDKLKYFASLYLSLFQSTTLTQASELERRAAGGGLIYLPDLADPSNGSFYSANALCWGVPDALKGCKGLQTARALPLEPHYGNIYGLKKFFTEMLKVRPFLDIEVCYAEIRALKGSTTFDPSALEIMYRMLHEYVQEKQAKQEDIFKVLSAERLIVVGPSGRSYAPSEVWIDHPTWLDNYEQFSPFKAVKRAYPELEKKLLPFFKLLGIPSCPTNLSLIGFLEEKAAELDDTQRNEIYLMLNNNKLFDRGELNRVKSISPVAQGWPITSLWWSQPDSLDGLLGTDRDLSKHFKAELKDFFCQQLGVSNGVPLNTVLDILDQPKLSPENAALVYNVLLSNLNTLRTSVKAAFAIRSLFHTSAVGCLGLADVWWDHGEELDILFEQHHKLCIDYAKDPKVHKFFQAMEVPNHPTVSHFVSFIESVLTPKLGKDGSLSAEDLHKLGTCYQEFENCAKKGKLMISSMKNANILLTCAGSFTNCGATPLFFNDMPSVFSLFEKSSITRGYLLNVPFNKVSSLPRSLRVLGVKPLSKNFKKELLGQGDIEAPLAQEDTRIVRNLLKAACAILHHFHREAFETQLEGYLELLDTETGVKCHKVKSLSSRYSLYSDGRQISGAVVVVENSDIFTIPSERKILLAKEPHLLQPYSLSKELLSLLPSLPQEWQEGVPQYLLCIVMVACLTAQDCPLQKIQDTLLAYNVPWPAFLG